MSKQIRVSEAQYKMLTKLSEELGVTRVEILSNAITLAKLLVDRKAGVLKMINKDGEQELLVPLFIGADDEG